MQLDSVQASSSDHVPLRSPTRFPTLVLLPGMDGTGDLFDPLIEALGADFKVLVVRYPETQSLGYDELVSYVGSLLPANEPFVLLGESFSGPIAIKLAAASRPGLQGLILCCTFARNPRPALAWLRGLLPWVPFTWIPSTLLSWALLGSFATGTLRSLLKEAVGRVSPTVMRARARSVLGVDVTVELSQVRVPCLYLQASADRLVPASAATLIQGALASVQLVQLDAPHCLLQGVAEESADALVSFVRRL